MRKSRNHVRCVMVLKPYFCSMWKIEYRLKGRASSSQARERRTKKSHPETVKERPREAIQEL